MAKATKAHRAKLARLERDLDESRARIYSITERKDVTFSECFKLSSAEARAANIDAARLLSEFEGQMVAEGRAWRSPTGTIYYYN
jgi:hypothetical protein